MFKVNPVDQKMRDAHWKDLAVRVEKSLANWSVETSPPQANSIDGPLITFFRTHLRSILVGDQAVLSGILAQFALDFPALDKYLKKNTSKQPKSPEFDAAIVQMKLVFNYDLFSERTVWGAYSLVRQHSLRLCPYCQLHHVNYHQPAKGDPGLQLRPPLDHYFPRSKYPYLGVSLYNLVPCCYQCNSGIKSDNTPPATIPHPFDAGCPIDIEFDTGNYFFNKMAEQPTSLVLRVIGKGGSADHVAFFRLQERHQWYKSEILDLFQRCEDFHLLDPQWRSVIDPERYVLGFARVNASERALGACLLGISRAAGLLTP